MRKVFLLIFLLIGGILFANDGGCLSDGGLQLLRKKGISLQKSRRLVANEEDAVALAFVYSHLVFVEDQDSHIVRLFSQLKYNESKGGWIESYSGFYILWYAELNEERGVWIVERQVFFEKGPGINEGSFIIEISKKGGSILNIYDYREKVM